MNPESAARMNVESAARTDFDRRRFLVTGAVALGAFGLRSASASTRLRLFLPLESPKTVAATRTLVVLQLSGGNDGLSTVVPHGDDVYGRNRSATRIDAASVLRIDDYRGLHPELKRLKKIYDGGLLAIVEGCGYPEPIRSHFKSMEVWHTARSRGRSSGGGWIGRACDAAGGDAAAEFTVHIGPNVPYSVYSPTHPAIAFPTPEGYRWVATDGDDLAAYREAGAPEGGGKGVLQRLRGVLADAQESSLRIRKAAAMYRPKAEYPQDDLGNALRAAAAVISAELGTRVVSVELGNFDSHNNQRRQHDESMRRLAAGLGAFLEDLHSTSAGDATVVATFSEFGRRVKENGSGGTDHGVAGPMFVAGTKVKGGLHGKHPSMTDLTDGDLAHTTDFRSVYATLIEDWLGIDASKVLDARYPKLAFV